MKRTFHASLSNIFVSICSVFFLPNGLYNNKVFLNLDISKLQKMTAGNPTDCFVRIFQKAIFILKYCFSWIHYCFELIQLKQILAVCKVKLYLFYCNVECALFIRVQTLWNKILFLVLKIIYFDQPCVIFRGRASQYLTLSVRPSFCHC